MLYKMSLLLIYFICGGLSLLTPYLYTATPHFSKPSGNH